MSIMDSVDKIEEALVRLCKEHGAPYEGGNGFYVADVAQEAGVDPRMVGMAMLYAEATLRERWHVKHGLRVRYRKQGLGKSAPKLFECQTISPLDTKYDVEA